MTIEISVCIIVRSSEQYPLNEWSSDESQDRARRDQIIDMPTFREVKRRGQKFSKQSWIRLQRYEAQKCSPISLADSSKCRKKAGLSSAMINTTVSLLFRKIRRWLGLVRNTFSEQRSLTESQFDSRTGRSTDDVVSLLKHTTLRVLDENDVCGTLS